MELPFHVNRSNSACIGIELKFGKYIILICMFWDMEFVIYYMSSRYQGFSLHRSDVRERLVVFVFGL